MVRWSLCGEAWGQAEHHGNKNVRDSKASHLQKNPQPLNWHQWLDTTTPNQRLDTTTPNQRLYGIKMQIHLGRECLNPWRGSLFRTNFLRKCSPGAVTRYTEVTVAAGYITSQQKGLVLMSMWCWLYKHTKLQSGRVTETFTRIAGRCRGQAMCNRVSFCARRPETMK